MCAGRQGCTVELPYIIMMREHPRSPPHDLHGQTLNDAITCDCTRACMEGPAGAGVVRVRMRVCKVCARAAQRVVGALPHNKKMSGTSGKIIYMK